MPTSRVQPAAPLPLVEAIHAFTELAATLGWEAGQGLQVVDGAGLARRHHPDIDPARPALVLIEGADLAEIGKVLRNQYSLEHPLCCLDAGGEVLAGPRSLADLLEFRVGGEAPEAESEAKVESKAESEVEGLAPTYLALSKIDFPGSMLDLAEVIAHLRAPEGCPWDREQTHLSLRPYLLEEAYEAVEAIDTGDLDQLADELGDVLLQVVLHAQIAVEEGSFGLTHIVRAITEKLVRRHPHVFGDVEAETSDAVIQNWEALKREERDAKGTSTSPFSGIPKAMPALARAQAVQRKVKRLAKQRPTRPETSRTDLDIGAYTGLGALSPISQELLGASLLELVARAEASSLDAEAALSEVVARMVREAESDLETKAQDSR